MTSCCWFGRRSRSHGPLDGSLEALVRHASRGKLAERGNRERVLLLGHERLELRRRRDEEAPLVDVERIDRGLVPVRQQCEYVDVGLATDTREVLITHVLDAEPDHVLEFPPDSLWPLWTAIAVTVLFIGSIFTPWAVVYGAIPVLITLVGWFWPQKGISAGEMRRRRERGQTTPLEQVL